MVIKRKGKVYRHISDFDFVDDTMRMRIRRAEKRGIKPKYITLPGVIYIEVQSFNHDQPVDEYLRGKDRRTREHKLKKGKK